MPFLVSAERQRGRRSKNLFVPLPVLVAYIRSLWNFTKEFPILSRLMPKILANLTAPDKKSRRDNRLTKNEGISFVLNRHDKTCIRYQATNITAREESASSAVRTAPGPNPSKRGKARYQNKRIPNKTNIRTSNEKNTKSAFGASIIPSYLEPGCQSDHSSPNSLSSNLLPLPVSFIFWESDYIIKTPLLLYKKIGRASCRER